MKQKVAAELRLDSARLLKIEGHIKDTRKVFGRDEALVKVTKVNPIWITQDKLKKINPIEE